MEYTVVLGIDKKTLESLKVVWPTWKKHKPSLLDNRFVIFHNYATESEIRDVVGSIDVKFVHWPPHGVSYPRDGLTKWSNPQRAKMLAGFVHVPAEHVETPYWLKLDVDVVATSKDNWVQSEWFDYNPSIIAPAWSYSKPANQMLLLDEWVAKHRPSIFNGTPPLDIRPVPGSDLVSHPRVCSWCAFFATEFTKVCSFAAQTTIGHGQLPVDSQDGFMFYVARRAGFSIHTVAMKKYGWCVRGNLGAVHETAAKVLAETEA